MDKPSPYAIAGAIATWLALALGLHAAAMQKMADVEAEVRTSRIIVEHRLTSLEVKVDGLAGRKGARLAAARGALWGE